MPITVAFAAADLGRVPSAALLLLTLGVAGAPAYHTPSRQTIHRPALRLPNRDPRHDNAGLVINSTTTSVLELGEITLLSVTDVHSWLAGHRHPDNEPALDADYGDLVSFRQHLVADAAARGKDVLLFNSGDMVDGTGLSDATEVHGEAVTPLVRQVPFDALVIGNHELYNDDTLAHLQDSGFVGHWGGRYLTSNVVGATDGEPIGARFAVITAPVTGARLLVLGFLYNFAGACPSSRVETVEVSLAAGWIKPALAAEDYAAVVVLAHMDLGNDLVVKILDVIRSVPRTSATPVAVLAGHTHYRGFRELDPAAVSLEAGRYFDTVGVLTLNLEDGGDGTDRIPAYPRAHGGHSHAARFGHVFVDANQASLAAACGRTAATFPTVAGTLLKAEIAMARAALGLDRVVGCSARMYKVDADFERDDSLWRLYMDDVVTLELFRPAQNPAMVAVASTGALRYDLFPGTVTRDDCYTISPFRDNYYLLGTLSAANLDQLVRALRADSPSSSSQWVHSPFDETAATALALVVTTFDLPRVSAEFERTVGRAADVSDYRHGDTDSSMIWEQFAQRHLPCAAPVAKPTHGGVPSMHGGVPSML